MKFVDIPKYTSVGNYEASMRLTYFVKWIQEQIDEYGLELNPDFQRGHVWTESQQERYIEHLLKGGITAKTVYFNHPGWMGNFEGWFVCVDGLQRITAIQKFMANEIKAFGAYLDEYEDKASMLRLLEVNVNVNNLKTRKDVLQWYLDFNKGGTVHSDSELERVQKLLDAEK